MTRTVPAKGNGKQTCRRFSLTNYVELWLGWSRGIRSWAKRHPSVLELPPYV